MASLCIGLEWLTLSSSLRLCYVLLPTRLFHRLSVPCPSRRGEGKIQSRIILLFIEMESWIYILFAGICILLLVREHCLIVTEVITLSLGGLTFLGHTVQ